jgi:hypothetical protein
MSEKQLNVMIPAELKKAIGVMAAEKGTSKKEVVIDALLYYFNYAPNK